MQGGRTKVCGFLGPDGCNVAENEARQSKQASRKGREIESLETKRKLGMKENRAKSWINFGLGVVQYKERAGADNGRQAGRY